MRQVLPFVRVVVEQLRTPFDAVHDLNRAGEIALVATYSRLSGTHGSRGGGGGRGCGRRGAGLGAAQQLGDVNALGAVFEQLFNRERSGGWRWPSRELGGCSDGRL